MASEAIAREARLIRQDLIGDQNQVTDRILRSYVDAYEAMVQRIERDAEMRMQRYGEVVFSSEEARLLDLGRELEAAGIDVAPMMEAATETQRLAGIHQADGLARASANPTMRGAFGRLNVDAVQALAERTAERRPMSQLLQTGVNEHRTKAESILLNYQALGKNPREVARDLARQLRAIEGGTLARWTTVARTEMLDANRNGMSAMFQRYNHVVQAKERMCAFDERTCMACIALDGTHYPLDAPMDDHQNGRCTWLPVLIDRYSNNQAERQYAQDWFGQQSNDVQRRMMGQRMHELLQSGEISLSDLAHHRHNHGWRDAYYQASIDQALSNARSRRYGGGLLRRARTPLALVGAGHTIANRAAYLRHWNNYRTADTTFHKQQALVSLFQQMYADSTTGLVMRPVGSRVPVIRAIDDDIQRTIESVVGFVVRQLHPTTYEHVPQTPAAFAAFYSHLLGPESAARLLRIDPTDLDAWSEQLNFELYEFVSRKIPPALPSGYIPPMLNPGPSSYLDWFVHPHDDSVLRGVKQNITSAQYRYPDAKFGDHLSQESQLLSRETWEAGVRGRVVESRLGTDQPNGGYLFSRQTSDLADPRSPDFQLLWTADADLPIRVDPDELRDFFSLHDQRPIRLTRITPVDQLKIRPTYLTPDPNKDGEVQRLIAHVLSMRVATIFPQEALEGLAALAFEIYQRGDFREFDDFLMDEADRVLEEAGDPHVQVFAQVAGGLISTLANPTLYGFQQAGAISRRVRDDETIYHASMFLGEPYQGLGWATWFNSRAMSYYISHGIKRINVSAADIGRWQWMTQGFEPQGFNPMQMIRNQSFTIREMVQQEVLDDEKLSDYINLILARQEQGGMSAREFAYLGYADRWTERESDEAVEREMWFGKVMALEAPGWSGTLRLEPPSEGKVWGIVIPDPDITQLPFPRLFYWDTAVAELSIDPQAAVRGAITVALVANRLLDVTTEQADQLVSMIRRTQAETQVEMRELPLDPALNVLREEVDRLMWAVDEELRQERLTLLDGIRRVMQREYGTEVRRSALSTWFENLLPPTEEWVVPPNDGWLAQQQAVGREPGRAASNIWTLPYDHTAPRWATYSDEIADELLAITNPTYADDWFEWTADLSEEDLQEMRRNTWSEWVAGSLRQVPDEIEQVLYESLQGQVDDVTFRTGLVQFRESIFQGYTADQAIDEAWNEWDPEGEVNATNLAYQSSPVWAAWLRTFDGQEDSAPPLPADSEMPQGAVQIQWTDYSPEQVVATAQAALGAAISAHRPELTGVARSAMMLAFWDRMSDHNWLDAPRNMAVNRVSILERVVGEALRTQIVTTPEVVTQITQEVRWRTAHRLRPVVPPPVPTPTPTSSTAVDIGSILNAIYDAVDEVQRQYQRSTLTDLSGEVMMDLSETVRQTLGHLAAGNLQRYPAMVDIARNIMGVLEDHDMVPGRLIHHDWVDTLHREVFNAIPMVTVSGGVATAEPASGWITSMTGATDAYIRWVRTLTVEESQRQRLENVPLNTLLTLDHLGSPELLVRIWQIATQQAPDLEQADYEFLSRMLQNLPEPEPAQSDAPGRSFVEGLIDTIVDWWDIQGLLAADAFADLASWIDVEIRDEWSDALNWLAEDGEWVDIRNALQEFRPRVQGFLEGRDYRLGPEFALHWIESVNIPDDVLMRLAGSSVVSESEADVAPAPLGTTPSVVNPRAFNYLLADHIVDWWEAVEALDPAAFGDFVEFVGEYFSNVYGDRININAQYHDWSGIANVMETIGEDILERLRHNHPEEALEEFYTNWTASTSFPEPLLRRLREEADLDEGTPTPAPAPASVPDQAIHEPFDWVREALTYYLVSQYTIEDSELDEVREFLDDWRDQFLRYQARGALDEFLQELYEATTTEEFESLFTGEAIDAVQDWISFVNLEVVLDPSRGAGSILPPPAASAPLPPTPDPVEYDLSAPADSLLYGNTSWEQELEVVRQFIDDPEHLDRYALLRRDGGEPMGTMEEVTDRATALRFDTALREASIVAGGGVGGARYGGRTGSRPMEEVLADLAAQGQISPATLGATDPAVQAQIDKLRKAINDDLDVGAPPRISDLQELADLLGQSSYQTLQDLLSGSAEPIDIETLTTYLRRVAASGQSIEGLAHLQWLAEMLGATRGEAVDHVLNPPPPEQEPAPVGLSDAAIEQIMDDLRDGNDLYRPTVMGTPDESEFSFRGVVNTSRFMTYVRSETGPEGRAFEIREALFDVFDIAEGAEDYRLPWEYRIEVITDWSQVITMQGTVGWNRLEEILRNPDAVHQGQNEWEIRPLVVEWRPGQYMLIDGHHRAVAGILVHRAVEATVVSYGELVRYALENESSDDLQPRIVGERFLEALDYVDQELLEEYGVGFGRDTIPTIDADWAWVGLRMEPSHAPRFGRDSEGNVDLQLGEYVVMLRAAAASGPPVGTLGRVVAIRSDVWVVEWNGYGVYNIDGDDLVRRVTVERFLSPPRDMTQFDGPVLYSGQQGEYTFVVYDSIRG